MRPSNNVRKRVCHFCKKKILEVDYRDAETLRRFLGVWSKIRGGSETGTCAKHQRQLTQAIKRSRFMSMLPYVSR